MRKLAIVALCAALGGCGLMAMKQRQEQMAAAIAAKDQGIGACKAQYPDENKDFVARNKCSFEAAKVVRPFATYPDLFDKSWATVAVLAEELDAKKITRAQGELQLAQMNSEIIAEEQRRNLANRSVAAQESAASAAWMASRPVTCNRVGTSTTCY
ncbi:hypothetical protein [Bradyrhizobium sp. Tv2a-2]|uniref:hypothetical protein n=1 Tax=Bradyrhizobium sp. Tv2a-2 TaxID=113395 RepID=UPI000463B67A|nr:hypothetical protein [Bradyrhizobium sp. Tv2a-2]